MERKYPRRMRQDPLLPRGGLAAIDDILRRWVRQNKATGRVRDDTLFAQWNAIVWKDLVGEDLAGRTRIVDLVRGELIVEVDSAALLNELSTYYRQEILESLRQLEAFRGVQRLRFRAGSF